MMKTMFGGFPAARALEASEIVSPTKSAIIQIEKERGMPLIAALRIEVYICVGEGVTSYQPAASSPRISTSNPAPESPSDQIPCRGQSRRHGHFRFCGSQAGLPCADRS